MVDESFTKWIKRYNLHAYKSTVTWTIIADFLTLSHDFDIPTEMQCRQLFPNPSNLQILREQQMNQRERKHKLEFESVIIKVIDFEI